MDVGSDGSDICDGSSKSISGYMDIKGSKYDENGDKVRHCTEKKDLPNCVLCVFFLRSFSQEQQQTFRAFVLFPMSSSVITYTSVVLPYRYQNV
jgi:hypothetical protein